MATNILPIAAASLVSALAGVVLTLVFTTEALDSIPDNVSDPTREVAQEMRTVKVRLERVERVLARELSATRRDIHQALGAVGSADTTGRPATRGAAPAESAPPAASHVFRDSIEPMAPKNVPALAPLSNWKADEDLRKKWLFASETVSLESFGTPDEVAVRGGSEWWTYWIVDAGAIASEYRLQFNNGRLVEAALLEWEKPRALPVAAR